MNDETSRLFQSVAKKMGWLEKEGLDIAEQKLMKSVGKPRRAGTCGRGSESEDDPEKENRRAEASSQKYREKILIESSDDDFDQFLLDRATPGTKAASQKPHSADKTDRSKTPAESSDDSFEKFLERVKTPNVKKKMFHSSSEDSLKNFIVTDLSSDDDFIKKKSSSQVPKSGRTPAAAQRPAARPPSEWDSPVFVSDSDSDDDSIVIKSTWRSRHSKPRPLRDANKAPSALYGSPAPPSPPLLPSSPPPLPSLHSLTSCKPPAPLTSAAPPGSPRRTHSAPVQLHETSSSDEEFTSLLERLKRKNKLTNTPLSSKSVKDCSMKPPAPVPPVKKPTAPPHRSLSDIPPQMKTPGNPTIPKPKASQTEPRGGTISRTAMCKTPGCFLESLSNPGPNYGRNFKQNKEELTSKLYLLYNTSVFDSKLPANMSVTWNKKMRKTAGYCITGQERGGGSRYARIELSEKVCDSADRLRDTLVHEMCHAATWLIHNVRDGHGNFWKLYARKATLAHPELPMVTRCHSYDIKYKFQYQCTRCKNTIGRHSKSLDTQRFACRCTGQLVLLTPSKRAPTPFANFVKENYGSARQELAGQSHADVMRKLSADFAATKVS